MILTIEAQFISLLMSVFAGLMVGLLFDLYRTINYYARPSKAFLYFMDLLFWIVTCSVVFIILLNADFARLRVYTFAGMGIGIFIYFKLFSGYMLKFYRLTGYAAGKFCRLLFIMITLPFKILYNLLWTPMNFVKKLLGRVGRGLKICIVSVMRKINIRK